MIGNFDAPNTKRSGVSESIIEACSNSADQPKIAESVVVEQLEANIKRIEISPSKPSLRSTISQLPNEKYASLFLLQVVPNMSSQYSPTNPST